LRHTDPINPEIPEEMMEVRELYLRKKKKKKKKKRERERERERR